MLVQSMNSFSKNVMKFGNYTQVVNNNLKDKETKHILIVDDEPYNLLSLQMVLKLCFKQLGWKQEITEHIIDQASNGHEALQKVKTMCNKDIKYGLIFMDCSMPIMNGYDASDAIRHFYK